MQWHVARARRMRETGVRTENARNSRRKSQTDGGPPLNKAVNGWVWGVVGEIMSIMLGSAL